MYIKYEYINIYLVQNSLGVLEESNPSNSSKKSPTGPTERTPKPVYLIALGTYLGVRWSGPIQFLMELYKETQPYCQQKEV